MNDLEKIMKAPLSLPYLTSKASSFVSSAMQLLLLIAVRCLWLSWVCAMQHYPASWGHYDVCKSQVYTEDRLAWHYMACQPEATDMTKYLRVSLDPPNITCGDPPEMYCALVRLRSSCTVVYFNTIGTNQLANC